MEPGRSSQWSGGQGAPYTAVPNVSRNASRPAELDFAAPQQRNAGAVSSAQGSRSPRGSTPKDHDLKQMISSLLDRPESSPWAQAMHYFLIVTIITSTVGAIVETVPEYSGNPIFFPIEMLINALFTIEFALRLYASDSIQGFATNIYNLIDFFAIFPGFVDAIWFMYQEADTQSSLFGVHKAAGSMRTLRMVRVLRLIRVLRVLRVAKVARHSRLLSILFAVFRKVSQSGLIVVLMLLSFVTVLSASFIYLFESELCESTGINCTGPSAFVSIPASFWWAIATLTTVGYGDMVPHTSAGRIVGALTAMTGVIIVAIGVALVSISFREVFIEEKARADLALRTGASAPGPEVEEQEILVLLDNFSQKSRALLTKLHKVSSTSEGCGPEFAPMLDVLGSHAEALSSDVKVFIDRVLYNRKSTNPA